MDCFSNVYKKFYRKIIFRKYLYFLFELKVISSPVQFVQWPVIKIFNIKVKNKETFCYKIDLEKMNKISTNKRYFFFIIKNVCEVTRPAY